MHFKFCRRIIKTPDPGIMGHFRLHGIAIAGRTLSDSLQVLRLQRTVKLHQRHSAAISTMEIALPPLPPPRRPHTAAATQMRTDKPDQSNTVRRGWNPMPTFIQTFRRGSNTTPTSVCCAVNILISPTIQKGIRQDYCIYLLAYCHQAPRETGPGRGHSAS